MTFATVEGRELGATAAANVTSHAITLPLSGSAIGDLLLVAFSVDASETVSVLSGSNWVKEVQATVGTAATAAIYWKRCETTSEALVLGTTTEQSSHLSWRFRGAARPYVQAAVTGTSNSTNPPDCVPALGSRDFIWIATRHGDSSVRPTAAPASYGDFRVSSGSGTGGTNTAAAERSLTAATEDPGTFTCNSEDWVSFTIAIVPDIVAAETDFALLSDTSVLRMLPVGKVSWAQLAAPEGVPSNDRAVSDGVMLLDAGMRFQELLQQEGLLKSDAQLKDQLTLTQDAHMFGDVSMRGRDSMQRDAPLLGDALIKEHLPLILEAVLLSDMDARGQDLTLSDLMLLKDYFFIGTERNLIDALLLGDSVEAITAAITEYLRAAVDGLFMQDTDVRLREHSLPVDSLTMSDTDARARESQLADGLLTPDVDVRVREHGQLEMLLSMDLVARAQELGKLDQLLLADAFLQALMPIGKVTWAKLEVGAAGGTVFEVNVMDGMQFFDPDSKAQEPLQRDFMFLAEQRYADLALQRLTALLLGDVIEALTTGARSIDVSDGLYLPDVRTFDISMAFMSRLLLETVPLVRTWNDIQSDYLFLLDEVQFFSAQEVHAIDGLLMSTQALLKELSLVPGREGLLLGDVVDVVLGITGNQYIQNSSDGLYFSDSRSSELLRALLVFILLDSVRVLERSHTERDSMLVGEALTQVRELVRQDGLLLVESLIEALRIASGVLEQTSTDNLMFGEARRSDLMKTVMVGLLLDSVLGKDLARATITDQIMFADSYARGIDAMRVDEILLGEVSLLSREALWSEGLVFSETFERRIIAYLINHLTFAQLTFNKNYLGIRMVSNENYLGVAMGSSENFLGARIGFQKDEVFQ